LNIDIFSIFLSPQLNSFFRLTNVYIFCTLGSIKKNKKKKVVKICPIWINGLSTGHLPIHDKIINEINNIKNINCIIGLNDADFFLMFIRAGKYRIIMEVIRAITPPSLLGIDRKIA